MKHLDPGMLDQLKGSPLGPGATFRFRCHSALGCYTQCCRNLNLFLYPYDVLRLKNGLKISADMFIDRYVDIVLREGHHFPEVLLRMADDPQRSCTFLTPEGCRVYADRPHTCRTFPVEQGILFDARSASSTPLAFFRPPDFCLGPKEPQQWTIDSWSEDQQAGRHYDFNLRWAEVRRLFERDPWGGKARRGARPKWPSWPRTIWSASGNSSSTAAF